MITKCKNCGILIKYAPSADRKYCSTKCQMHYEYKTGIRDKYKIGIKARKVAQSKMAKHNWLNDKNSRDKLKQSMQTKEYRLKARNAKLGEKNGMYGMCGPLNPAYNGGSKRTYGHADRGFDWKNIKKLVKKRDENICQICGIKEKDCIQNLQVHHKVPYKCTEDNSLDNLISVCSKCHRTIEPRFLKVNKIEHIPKEKKVYNISVADDETYVANNVVAHNCRSDVIYFIE